MDNKLLLMSGENIPFIEAQTSIRQPKLREISLIGEQSFLSGSKTLTFNKNMLNVEDKTGLEDKTDFDIIMSIMCSKEKIEQKNDVTLLLSLLFPTCQIKYTNNEIILLDSNTNAVSRINNFNYEVFKDILSDMFCLNEIFEKDGGYNPVGRRAEKIAAKLQAAKDRKAKKAGGETTKVAIYSQYVSILAVGEYKNINELMDYTIYQITDEFKRFQKKVAYDMNIKARLAGVTDLDDVDNWMEDIHP